MSTPVAEHAERAAADYLRNEDPRDRSERKQVMLIAELITKTVSAFFGLIGSLMLWSALASGGLVTGLFAVGFLAVAHDAFKLSSNVADDTTAALLLALQNIDSDSVLGREFISYCISRFYEGTIVIGPLANWAFTRLV